MENDRLVKLEFLVIKQQHRVEALERIVAQQQQQIELLMQQVKPQPNPPPRAPPYSPVSRVADGPGPGSSSQASGQRQAALSDSLQLLTSQCERHFRDSDAGAQCDPPPQRSGIPEPRAGGRSPPLTGATKGPEPLVGTRGTVIGTQGSIMRPRSEERPLRRPPESSIGPVRSRPPSADDPCRAAPVQLTGPPPDAAELRNSRARAYGVGDTAHQGPGKMPTPGGERGSVGRSSDYVLSSCPGSRGSCGERSGSAGSVGVEREVGRSSRDLTSEFASANARSLVRQSRSRESSSRESVPRHSRQTHIVK